MEELFKEPPLLILTRGIVDAIVPLAAAVVVSMNQEFDGMSDTMRHTNGFITAHFCLTWVYENGN